MPPVMHKGKPRHASSVGLLAAGDASVAAPVAKVVTEFAKGFEWGGLLQAAMFVVVRSDCHVTARALATRRFSVSIFNENDAPLISAMFTAPRAARGGLLAWTHNLPHLANADTAFFCDNAFSLPTPIASATTPPYRHLILGGAIFEIEDSGAGARPALDFAKAFHGVGARLGNRPAGSP